MTIVDPSGVLDVLVFAVVTVVAVVPAAYLAALAALSLRSRPSRTSGAARTRFAILIPAHDEEQQLPELLASIDRLDYPKAQYSVHVVADNCTDGTALIASRWGAAIHVRNDPDRPGKPAALNWLVRRVVAHDHAEAFVFVDADSTLDPGFLRGIEQALHAGALVVQPIGLIARSSDRPLTLARVLAFHLICQLRPLAYEALGASVGLHGNGVCLHRALALRFPFDEESVVEDGALHLRLVRAGVRVRLAPGAVVRARVPDTLSSAVGHTVRWERGKIDLAGAAFRSIGDGLALGDRSMVIAGIEILVPTFSTSVAVTVASLAVALVFGGPLVMAAALAAATFLVLYVVRGFALSRLGPRDIAALGSFAVPYVTWKMVVLARVIGGAGRGRWERAARQ